MREFKPTHERVAVLPNTLDPNAKHTLLQLGLDNNGKKIVNIKIPTGRGYFEEKFLQIEEVSEFVKDLLISELIKYEIKEE